MKNLIEVIRQGMRLQLRWVARWIDRASKGKVTPDAVTIFGLLMHLPIAIMIARGRFVLAAILLLVFGLLDTLDGELARFQKRSSDAGGMLDAATDRFKETMLYAGAAYFLAASDQPTSAIWAVVACGASLSVSYVKAKGEAIIASQGRSKALAYTTLNRVFADGLLPFELRMFVLWVGLLSGTLLAAVMIIAILASLTAMQRLVLVTAKLR